MNKKNFKRLIIIIGILIIPLLYSYFYLKAFYDPYSKLNSLPVAIVNEDNGYLINDNNRNIGSELEKKLIKSNSLAFESTTSSKASKGLEDRKYYAIIKIPSDFTESIASANSENKEVAIIKFIPNEKYNYLAAQIISNATLKIEEEMRGLINKEVVLNLVQELNAIPDSLETLNDGVNTLANGSNNLNNGINKLKDSLNEYQTNYNLFNSAIKQTATGINTISTGSNNLNNGINQVLSGTKTLDTQTSGLATLSTGTQTYIDNVNSTIDNAIALNQALLNYKATHPEIMGDATMASIINNIGSTNTALLTLKGSGTYLKSNLTGLSQINPAIKQIVSGLQNVSVGADSLNSGISKLNIAGTTLSNNSDKLYNASVALYNGSTTLSNGTQQLSNGLLKMNQALKTSIIDANTKLSKLNGLDDYAKKPVTIKKESFNKVSNYGTAFAPYFLSLSLWVGSLIIMVVIYLDADERFKILSRHSDNKLLRTTAYGILSLLQALLLAVVIQFGLHLTVNNVVLYYLACCLTSITFMAIVQFLIIHLKDIGKFLAILLLILQLTSCAGTFPKELLPTFFKVLYPFMPMSYSVNLFKETISGFDNSFIAQNSMILLLIFFTFFILTIIFNRIKKKKQL